MSKASDAIQRFDVKTPLSRPNVIQGPHGCSALGDMNCHIPAKAYTKAGRSVEAGKCSEQRVSEGLEFRPGRLRNSRNLIFKSAKNKL